MKKLLILALFILLPFAAVAEDVAPAAEQEVAAVPAAPPPPPPAARKWEMVDGESSIAFSGKQMGKDFAGKIAKFTAEIYFDPEKLDQSSVTAEMDMRFIDTQDAERDKNLMSKDWLSVIDFPTARFETHKIAKTGDNAYLADATLTIHGAIQEIQLPFTLEFSNGGIGKDKAVMKGQITLDRSKFQLGTGEWEDPSVIANEIPVTVTVTALSKKP